MEIKELLKTAKKFGKMKNFLFLKLLFDWEKFLATYAFGKEMLKKIEKFVPQKN